MTISDWILPTLLVTSGLSLSFLLRDPPTWRVGSRLARRFLLLLVIGIAYNAYGTSWLDLSSVRVTGVLQMIGVSGAVAAGVVLAFRGMGGQVGPRVLVVLASAMAGLYGVGLDVLRCEPVGRCSPFFALDTRLLGVDHVYRAGQVGWDPEGLVLSVAASSLVLFGCAAGFLLQLHGRARRSDTLKRIGGLATLCLLAGSAAGFWIPPNKRLLSPSFILLAAGSSLAVFCFIYLIVDARRCVDAYGRLIPRGPVPATQHIIAFLNCIRQGFIALGRNALLVFVLERVLYQTAKHLQIGGRSVEEILLEYLAPLGGASTHLAYSALVLGLVWSVAAELHARRWYLAL